MSDDLSDLLDRAVRDVPVGVPPLPALHAGARTVRRRRALTAGAGVATLAVVASVAALTLPGSAGGPAGRDRGSVAAGPTSPPADEVLLGVGSVAVRVPAAWLDGETWCGSARTDVALVGEATRVQPACAAVWGRDATAVYVDAGTVRLDGGSTPVTVDGVPGRRSTVECGDSDLVRPCSGWLHLTGPDVTVRVATGRSGADGTATIERLLDTVTVEPGLTAVPAFDATDGRLTAEEYADVLARNGFQVQTQVTYSEPAGTVGLRVAGVEPREGTMLPPGSPVTVLARGAVDLRHPTARTPTSP